MNIIFESAKEQFEHFLSLDSESDEYIESGKRLLKEIRESGRYITDFSERDRLAIIAKNIADRLYDSTGAFFVTYLFPLNAETNGKKRQFTENMIPAKYYETTEELPKDVDSIRKRIDELAQSSAKMYEDSQLLSQLLKESDSFPKVIHNKEDSIKTAQELLHAIPLFLIPEPTNLPLGSRMPFHQNPLFVGRSKDLQTLASALKNERTIVAITGMGGIGKTQLASEFVHRYGRYFAGGVFWLSFADPDNIPNEVAVCGSAAYMNIPGFASLSLTEQVGRVKLEWHNPMPRLLVFDNCEDEQLLYQWLPKTGGCRVLITSRRSQWTSLLEIQTHRLDVLPRTDSIALLRHFRPDADETDAHMNELATVLGDLPLALHLAGSYLNTYQNDIAIKAYLDELQDEVLLNHESLQGADLGISPTNHELNISKAIAKSYQKLDLTDSVDALALALLSRMVWFAPSIPIPRDVLLETIASSDSIPKSKRLATRALNRLANLGLLDIKTETQTSTLRLHRLIANFVLQQESDIQAQQDVFQTILQYVTKASDDGEAAKIIPIHTHIHHVLSYKMEDATINTLEQIDCHIAIAESDSLLRNVKNAESHYTQANKLIEQVEKDKPSENLTHSIARLCYGMGTLLEYTDPDAALNWISKGLDTLKESNNRDEAKLAFRKGAIYNGKEFFAQAEEFLTKSRNLLGEDDESIWMIRTLSNLGIAESSQGNYAQGREWYDKALTLCEKTNNRYEQIPIYNNQAYDLDLAGQWNESAENYQKAIELALEFRERETLVSSLLNLGILYTNMGEDVAAQKYLEQGIQNARLYSIDEKLILAQMAKVDLYIRQEKWEEATACIEEVNNNSTIITSRIQSEIHRSWALIYLAQSEREKAREGEREKAREGEREKAREHAKHAVDCSDEGADANMEMGMSYRVLGQVTFASGNYDEAIDHFRMSLSYVKDVIPYEAARTHLEWGRAELERGNHTEAKDYLEQARKKFAELGAKRDLAIVEELEREMIPNSDE